DDQATPLKTMVVTNVDWLLGESYLVKAGDKDASFRVEMSPSLFTQGKRVEILGVLPHMHALGTRIGVDVERADGSRSCLLDIQHWDLGWTQPYVLAQPLILEPGDKVKLECHIDNTDEHRLALGDSEAARDIAWG